MNREHWIPSFKNQVSAPCHIPVPLGFTHRQVHFSKLNLPQLHSFQTFHIPASNYTAGVLSHIFSSVHFSGSNHNTWVTSQIARLPPLADDFFRSPLSQWTECASSQPSIHFFALAHLTRWLSIIQCTLQSLLS